jgi:hypothetical protein
VDLKRPRSPSPWVAGRDTWDLQRDLRSVERDHCSRFRSFAGRGCRAGHRFRFSCSPMVTRAIRTSRSRSSKGFVVFVLRTTHKECDTDENGDVVFGAHGHILLYWFGGNKILFDLLPG